MNVLLKYLVYLCFFYSLICVQPTTSSLVASTTPLSLSGLNSSPSPHPALPLLNVNSQQSVSDRVCTVFCSGELLTTLQLANLSYFGGGNDSKTFVDCPLKSDPELVVQAFHALSPRPVSPDQLNAFAKTYFGAVGSDLKTWLPPDWAEIPPLLRNKSGLLWTNTTLRNFTYALNHLWLDLGRAYDEDVYSNPQRHTLIPAPHPLIVPGGRFRESYYWDTYWIIQGLLVSNMSSTAQGIIDNFLYYE